MAHLVQATVDEDLSRINELVTSTLQFLELALSTTAVNRAAELLPIPLVLSDEFVAKDLPSTAVVRHGLVPPEIVDALIKSVQSEEKAVLKFSS